MLDTQKPETQYVSKKFLSRYIQTSDAFMIKTHYVR